MFSPAFRRSWPVSPTTRFDFFSPTASRPPTPSPASQRSRAVIGPTGSPKRLGQYPAFLHLLSTAQLSLRSQGIRRLSSWCRERLACGPDIIGADAQGPCPRRLSSSSPRYQVDEVAQARRAGGAGTHGRSPDVNSNPLPRVGAVGEGATIVRLVADSGAFPVKDLFDRFWRNRCGLNCRREPREPEPSKCVGLSGWRSAESDVVSSVVFQELKSMSTNSLRRREVNPGATACVVCRESHRTSVWRNGAACALWGNR